jgi:hypothetical protein
MRRPTNTGASSPEPQSCVGPPWGQAAHLFYRETSISGIKPVPQPIAEEIEAENSEEDRSSRKPGKPRRLVDKTRRASCRRPGEMSRYVRNQAEELDMADAVVLLDLPMLVERHNALPRTLVRGELVARPVIGATKAQPIMPTRNLSNRSMPPVPRLGVYEI